MINILADAIASGNDNRFNASRGPKVFIGKNSYANLNLAKFNFENTTFNEVKFKHCNFEDLKSVRFTNCVFDQCVFLNSDRKKKDASFESIIFHQCDIKSSQLSFAVKDLTMVKTTLKWTNFKDAAFWGLLRVEHCRGFSQSANLRYSDRNLKEIVYEENDPKWYWKWTSWEALRFVLSVPITKISWLIFIVHSAILGMAYAAIRASEKLDVAATQFELDAGKYLSKVGPWITDSSLIQSASQNILLSIALICSSILFTYACPKEIKGYDRQQWIYELDQNAYIYDHISYLRTFRRVIAVLTLSVALTLLAIKYAEPIGTTVFRLADLAMSARPNDTETQPPQLDDPDI